MVLPFFAFQSKVDCARKVDTSQTSTAKFYTWYFWQSTPPCTSKPGAGAGVVYINYVYGRQSHAIVEVASGTCDSSEVL